MRPRRARTYPVIVSFREKHSTRMFVAMNDDEFGRIMLRVASERAAMPDWFCYPAPLPPGTAFVPPAVPTRVVADGVDATYDQAFTRKMIDHKYAVSDAEREHRFALVLHGALVAKNPEAAYEALRLRSDAEYEGMSVDEPEPIDAPARIG